MIETIGVELGSRSYAIHIGAGTLADANLYRVAPEPTEVLILTGQAIAPLYLEQVRSNFSEQSCHSLILADNEALKNLTTIEHILTFMLERGFKRGALLVALGGGVIGDMGGFAASCYQRGISYIQVPTTLLAQVDSSVGGKTAVNHRLGKNMIGAFHQPSAVITDTKTLTTLPDRELRAGIAEIIKYGLIRDLPFFEWLETNIAGLLSRKPDTLKKAISLSCKNKAEVVASDEMETGVRATLNFGHTFGHAIETTLGYGTWLHGEAVALGMCMATRLSSEIGLLTEEAVVRVESLFRRTGLPTTAPPGLSEEAMLKTMRGDKKNIDDEIRLVLLESLGSARVTTRYPREKLIDVIRGRSLSS